MTGRLVNPFYITGLFLYLLKTSENQRFSDAFRGYRMKPVVLNGLIGFSFERSYSFLVIQSDWN